MKAIGKCPPESEELQKAHKRGFREVELYLEKEHLINIHQTEKIVRNSPVKSASIHTPHVTVEEVEYLRKVDKLAETLDAYLVIHSQHILNIKSSLIEDIGLKSEHGYENNPGTSLHCIHNSVLKRSQEFVLDSAHLYIAENNYLKALKYLLSEYSEKIRFIHLNDSTKTKDGLAFGEGEVPVKETVKEIIKSNFAGKIVLEVMPEEQEEALEKFSEWEKEHK